jgi:putative Mg2+ transporter-C (MgtC) family protein
MLDWTEILLRLCIATAFGGLIGMERQRYDGGAGLRTHMLVCLGSCLMMIVSVYGFSEVLTKEHVALDPSRVAAQVVSGIGFLGAGTILFLRQEVIKGLTTAAGLWTAAGIGLATGGGLYFAAGVTTVLVLIILVVAKPYKKRLISRKQHNDIFFKLDKGKISLTALDDFIAGENLSYKNFRIANTKDNLYSIELRFDKSISQNTILHLVDKLNNIEGISNAELKAPFQH